MSLPRIPFSAPTSDKLQPLMFESKTKAQKAVQERLGGSLQTTIQTTTPTKKPAVQLAPLKKKTSNFDTLSELVTQTPLSKLEIETELNRLAQHYKEAKVSTRLLRRFLKQQGNLNEDAKAIIEQYVIRAEKEANIVRKKRPKEGTVYRNPVAVERPITPKLSDYSQAEQTQIQAIVSHIVTNRDSDMELKPSEILTHVAIPIYQKLKKETAKPIEESTPTKIYATAIKRYTVNGHRAINSLCTRKIDKLFIAIVESRIEDIQNLRTLDDLKKYTLNTSRMIEQELKALSSEIHQITAMINKLPKYRGITHRAILPSSDESFTAYTQRYKPGETVQISQFLSTSTKFEQAEKFGGTNKEDKIIFFKITGTSGARLLPVTENEHEDEVLYNRNTRFRVETAGPYPSEEYPNAHYIELREV